MANYYCEYCGTKKSSIKSLTHENCGSHPNGLYKGKHKLYEGTEKIKYACKYCGKEMNTIKILTASKCGKHPSGLYKGFHSPTI